MADVSVDVVDDASAPLLYEDVTAPAIQPRRITTRRVVYAISAVATVAALAAVVFWASTRPTPPGLKSNSLKGSSSVVLAAPVPQAMNPDQFCPDKKCEVDCQYFDNGVFDTSLAAGSEVSLQSAMLSAALSFYAYPDNLMGAGAEDPLNPDGLGYSDPFQARFTALFGQMGLTKYSFISAQAKEKYQTQAIVAASDTDVFLIFKGSSSVKDIIPDMSVKCTKTNLFGDTTTCVHNGFLGSYLASHAAIVRAIDDVVPLSAQKGGGLKIWLTGHSLGAALATVVASGLASEGYNVAGVTTFGSPRVGDLRFEEMYRHTGLSAITYRWVHEDDIVPQLPLEVMGYRHVGQRYVMHAGKCLYKADDECVSPGMIPGFCTQSTADHFMAGYASSIKTCLREEAKLAVCAIDNMPL